MSHPVPYSQALAGRDPLAVLEVTPTRWANLLRTVTPEQADIPTAPGKWSLREILIHLADCEIVWAWRLRQSLAVSRAIIEPFDQDDWARTYTAYTFADARATFLTLRTWNIAFLRGLSAEDRSKPITHPERGEETVWTIAEIMAGHDLHHLQALEDFI